MLMQIWKDEMGFRLQLEDSEYDLSPEAYQQMVKTMGEFEDEPISDEESTYTSLQLDLED